MILFIFACNYYFCLRFNPNIMITRLQGRSPLHMLPYPTHAHPTMSAQRHENSQPNPSDHNFWKYHGRSDPASHPTIYMCVAHHHHRENTQGQDENANKSQSTENIIGMTDATRIPMQTKMQERSDRHPNGSSQPATKHHELTQPASIREYGFYTNPNDATRPNIMDSLNQPQSRSTDSTRLLVSTKQKERSKETKITGIRSLNRS